MKYIAGLLTALALAAPACAGELDGVWSTASYTPLQRPKSLKTLAVTPADAEAYEAPRRALSGRLPSPADDLGQNESEFMDQGVGLAHIRGEIRSSTIIEPTNGRIPWKPGVFEAIGQARDANDITSDIKGRHTDDRCLTVTGTAAPIINSPEANILTIVESRDSIILAGEKNHEYRIVRVGAAASLPLEPPSRMGSSIGRWQGKTLVVVTTNYVDLIQDNYFGVTVSGHSKITEAFTRTGPAEITYRFSVEDPSLYAQVWSGEMVFRPGGPMFEYACHEGNYAMDHMLYASGQEEEARMKVALKP